MKYFIQVFGCQMNQSDAGRIAGLFESLGIARTDNLAAADIFVAVMCSVRQMAVDRIFGLEQKIKQAKKANPRFISILTGCVTENDKPRFAEIFGHILPINRLSEWPQFLGIVVAIVQGPSLDNDSCPRTDLGQFWSALIPISNGCDNFCSYCVVPYTRGPLVSRPVKNIVNEIRRAVQNGAKEVWLLGQNANNYHFGKTNFARLLRMVNDIPGDFWIRFTSPHPKDFTDEAVSAMAQCQKVTPYLNLPIQSGDNEILRAMKRPYTVAQYKMLVKKLRLAFKKYRRGLETQLAISTDVIVGFPGETKKQFENTVKTFTAVKYDMAYIAQYSRRFGTAAAQLNDNIPPKEKKQRQEAVNNIVKKTALGHNKKFVEKIVEVLVASIKGKEIALGKNRHYKTVKFKIGKITPEKLVGNFVKVKITRAQSFGLVGRLIYGK